MHHHLAFLNLGGQEMILIFVVILLLFGAKKLPELARGIGKSMGEFKKAREDFESEITRAETDSRAKDNARAREDEERRTRENLEAEVARLRSQAAIKEAPGKEPREV